MKDRHGTGPRKRAGRNHRVALGELPRARVCRSPRVLSTRRPLRLGLPNRRHPPAGGYSLATLGRWSVRSSRLAARRGRVPVGRPAVRGPRREAGGGLSGRSPFAAAVDGDALVASLALTALNALFGTSVLVFDTEMRYVLVAGRAASDPSFSSSFLNGRLAAEVLSAERWGFYEPLYRSALRGETHSVDVS